MDVKQEKIVAILNHEIVCNVVNEAVGNWIQNHEIMDPFVKKILVNFATKVAEKMLSGHIPFPDFINQSGWKSLIGDEVFQLLDLEEFVKSQVPVVVQALAPKFDDKTEALTSGLWGYSLKKIAQYTGCVTYMIANELDPNLLIMTADEASMKMREFAHTLASHQPEKVMIVNPETDNPAAIANDISEQIRKNRYH